MQKLSVDHRGIDISLIVGLAENTTPLTWKGYTNVAQMYVAGRRRRGR